MRPQFLNALRQMTVEELRNRLALARHRAQTAILRESAEGWQEVVKDFEEILREKGVPA